MKRILPDLENSLVDEFDEYEKGFEEYILEQMASDRGYLDGFSPGPPIDFRQDPESYRGAFAQILFFDDSSCGVG